MEIDSTGLRGPNARSGLRGPNARFAKVLIAVGLGVVALGVILVVGAGLGLGRLPGDIAVKRGNFRFFFPLATCLVLSLVLSLALALFNRR